MQKISLISPSSHPIVGAKLKDGSTTTFECHFDRKHGESIFAYEFPDGAIGNLIELNGEHVLIDSQGTEWAASDVEFKSTPPL